MSLSHHTHVRKGLKKTTLMIILSVIFLFLIAAILGLFTI